MVPSEVEVSVTCNILDCSKFAFRRNDVSKQTSLNAEKQSSEYSVEMDHEAIVGEETLEKLHQRKMESEGQQIEDENKIVVDENNLVSHYWKDEECRPLVHPCDATSLG